MFTSNPARACDVMKSASSNWLKGKSPPQLTQHNGSISQLTRAYKGKKNKINMYVSSYFITYVFR